MNVRFKKTDKGEIAILPRKEYEAERPLRLPKLMRISEVRG